MDKILTDFHYRDCTIQLFCADSGNHKTNKETIGGKIQNAIELFKKHQKDAILAEIESTTPKKISTPELFNLVPIL